MGKNEISFTSFLKVPLTNRWFPCWPTTLATPTCATLTTGSAAKHFRIALQRISHLLVTGLCLVQGVKCWREEYCTWIWQALTLYLFLLRDKSSLEHGSWVKAFYTLHFDPSCFLLRVLFPDWAWAWVCIHYMQTTKMHTPSIFFPILLEFSDILLQLTSGSELQFLHSPIAGAPQNLCSSFTSQTQVRNSSTCGNVENALPKTLPLDSSIPSHHHCMSRPTVPVYAFLSLQW